MGKLNKIFKISSTDFATLKENGEITKAGVTYKYDPDNLYLIENNLTDDYVLLGGGGNKLESELSVKKATQDGNGAVIANTYVKKESGKGLSTNDYTTAEKTKLSGIATGANKTTITNNLTTTSTGTALDAAQGKILNDKFTSGLYEANLTWGGGNLAGKVSPVDAGLNPRLSANRFDFFPSDRIKVEYSTDGGTTWIDYDAPESEKIRLVSSTSYGGQFFIGKKTSGSDTKTANDQLKVTLSNLGDFVYTQIRKFMFYVATSANKSCWVTIRANTYENKDSFREIVTKAPLLGWSGWNVVNIDNAIQTDGNHDSKGQVNALEFIFGADAIGYAACGSMYIQKLFAFHETCYRTDPTDREMAVLGTPYSLDFDKSATFMGAVKATSLYEGNTVLSDKYALKTAIPTVESLTTTDIYNAIK